MVLDKLRGLSIVKLDLTRLLLFLVLLVLLVFLLLPILIFLNPFIFNSFLLALENVAAEELVHFEIGKEATRFAFVFLCSSRLGANKNTIRNQIQQV